MKLELSIRARFLLDNLDLPRATGVDDAKFEYFQQCLWSDEGTFRIENKSRQIAWSWAIAADAIGSAFFEERDSIFVSINQDEAQEKIRYAKRIYESLRLSGLPKLIRDSQSEIEFDNGVRLTSLPSRPARGRARSNVYLDEFAHAPKDRAIYSGSLPVTSKGGRIRIGSSPLGGSGVFWEIFEQRLQAYPNYTRNSTPWWEIYAFCLNVKEARKLAPGMPTAHRVELFGNERIKAIYANMPEEDFRQEFECAFVDESTAWITWDEIIAAQESDLQCVTGKGVDGATQAIAQLRRWISQGLVEQTFVAGMDIGRTKDATEFFVLGVGRSGKYPIRLVITLQGVAFDDQLAVVVDALGRLPIARLYIDRNGIGRNLAENAQTLFPGIAFGVDFSNTSKTLWATDAKMLIQKGKTPLPVDRDLAYQIHSIKKVVTSGKNLVFDTDRNEKHHADKFWAWALGLAAGRTMDREEDDMTIVSVTQRM